MVICVYITDVNPLGGLLGSKINKTLMRNMIYQIYGKA